MSKSDSKKRRTAQAKAVRKNSGTTEHARYNRAKSAEADNAFSLSTEETDRLIMATGYGMAPEPISELDVDPVFEWARSTLIGASLLDLVLDGSTIPVGIKSPGEPGFRTIDGTLSEADAEEYRSELAKIQVGWTWTPSWKYSVSGNGDLTLILSEQEKASLGLAVATGNKVSGSNLEEAEMLSWAGVVRNDQLRLAHIIVGKLLPVLVEPPGHLEFKFVTDLPAADQLEYRRKLRKIKAMHRT